MSLKELVNLAETRKLVRGGYTEAVVPHVVVIDDTGGFVGLLENTMTLLIPARPKVTSGIKSPWVVAKSGYLLGFDDGRVERAKDMLQAYRELHSPLAEKDVGAASLLKFLDSDGERKKASDALGKTPNFTTDQLIAIQISGQGMLHERPVVREQWDAMRSLYLKGRTGQTTLDRGQCCVCGNSGDLAEIHEKIGGLGDFVSINDSAFESWGLRGGRNSPICIRCSEGFTSGLRYLYDPRAKPRRFVDLGRNVRVYFWSLEPESDETIGLIMETLADGDIKGMLEQPLHGRRLVAASSDLAMGFLSSQNMGRQVLRNLWSMPIQQLVGHVSLYFDEIGVQALTRYPLGSVLDACNPTQGRRQQGDGHLRMELFMTILLHRRFPDTLLHRVVGRFAREQQKRVERSGPAKNDAEKMLHLRAGLLKAILNRNYGMRIDKVLDTTRPNIGYKLGRLLALAEGLQYRAHDKRVGTTVADRYAVMASKHPANAFVHVFQLAQAWRKKANDSEFAELMAEIPEIPEVLPLPSQGEFWLGYYQQRQATLTRKQTKGAEDGNA